MTLDEKIGQIFIFGFLGKAMGPSLNRHIYKTKPGGLIIFQRNISSFDGVLQLNQSLQSLSHSYAKVPALIMIDQEGGSVSRLKWSPVQPSALSLGMHSDSKSVYQMGLHSGRVLSALGFNMNLAPVIDLSDPKQMNFMGNRAFGSNPERVNEMAFMFANGLSKADILPTLKHFPGHGGITEDSHRTTPTRNSTLEEKEKYDLIPFQFFSEVGLPSAMMVAHIAFPQIDPSGRPATFSEVLITEVLIKKMGYSGLIITDDLEMFGARYLPSVGQRVVEAFKAGNDMLMVGWNPKNQLEAVDAIKHAIKTGEIRESRLDHSVEKILRHKLVVTGTFDPPKRSLASVGTNFYKEIEETVHISNEILESNLKKSFDRLKELRGSITQGDELFVYSSDPAFFNGVKRDGFPNIHLKQLSPNDNTKFTLDLAGDDGRFGLFYVTGLGSARILEDLPPQTKSRLIVINATFPGAIPSPESYCGVFDIFTQNPKSGKLVAEFLLKGRPLQTRLNAID